MTHVATTVSLPRRTRAFATLACITLTACTGAVVSPGSTPGVASTVTDFTCGRDGDGLDAPLRRLSRRQYTNSVRDFVFRTLPATEADAVWDGLADALSQRPRDTFISHEEPGQRLFAVSDQSISEALIRSDMEVARIVAREVTTAARLGAFAGSCANDADSANDAACLDALVDRLGAITHRRPLDAAERSFFRDEVYSDGNVVVAEGVAELVEVFLRQPGFVFHVEGRGELTGPELASRLAYHFWNAPPDDALREAGEDGELLTEAGWDAQVERVLADPRAEDWIAEFLDEWLRIDRVVPLSTGSGGTFDALRGELVVDASLDAAVVQEIRDLFAFVLADGGTFEDFFMSELTLNSHAGLAALYGMPPSDGVTPMQVPPERAGILTRAAMLLPRSDITPPGPSPRTHPILRGVFLQRQIMCARIDPPPASAMDDLPEIDPTTTSSRDEADVLTSGGLCRGCHQVLNPPGFALEVFDALGRHRDAERLFANDGSEVGSVPVNAVVSLPQLNTTVRTPRELSDAIHRSEAASACFTRHYARYTLARQEDIDADGCLLRAVDEALDDGLPLRQVLAMPLRDPGFRARTGGE